MEKPSKKWKLLHFQKIIHFWQCFQICGLFTAAYFFMLTTLRAFSFPWCQWTLEPSLKKLAGHCLWKQVQFRGKQYISAFGPMTHEFKGEVNKNSVIHHLSSSRNVFDQNSCSKQCQNLPASTLKHAHYVMRLQVYASVCQPDSFDKPVNVTPLAWCQTSTIPDWSVLVYARCKW